MNMFESLLSSIPQSRLDLVNELEIPDVTLPPYIWRDIEPFEDSLSTDSLLSGYEEEKIEIGSINTDSSIALSRALTDSEISYGRYKRYKNMGYDNHWEQLSDALEMFPSDYLPSLNSFSNLTTYPDHITEELEDYAAERRRHREELQLRMNRFFDAECYAYLPDDPGLLALEEALDSLDMKALEAELATITRI